MKRQRNVDITDQNLKAIRVESTPTASTRTRTVEKKKKGKKAVEKQKEENKINGGDKDYNSCPRKVVDSYLNWGELPWLRGVVDEQMSWGSIWLPFWDVEYMGEACTEMFSDVVWDDDIWNLRNINQMPNP